MLILLSPSKTMSLSPAHPRALNQLLERGELSTQPAEMSVRSQAIIATLLRHVGEDEGRSIDPIRALMGVSERLARGVHQGLLSWRQEGAQTAILSYTGDVFKGLNPTEWSEGEWARAHAQLRVLSGLYGVLTPLAQISSYRLEMGLSCQGELARGLSQALKAPSSAEKVSLAQLWRPLITQRIQADKATLTSGWALNLSSQEYSQAVDFHALKLSVCAPRFLDLGPKGDYKIVSRYAKRARGLVARYALSVEASTPQDLAGFNLEGYQLAEAESRVEEGALTFKRDALPSP